MKKTVFSGRVFSKITSITAALFILTAFIPLSFYPLNKLVICLFEMRLDAHIHCRSLKIYLWKKVVAEEIEAVGKGGFALSAEKATIGYDLASVIAGRLYLNCDLENVKFYKASSIMSSVTDLLRIKPLGNLTFATIHAEFMVGINDTLTQNLSLVSDDIKIFGSAVTGRDNTVMSLLQFHFKDELVSEIPQDIRQSLLLKKEDGLWSSMQIGIMGNYEKPVLKIMAGRLRMNISS